NGMAQARPLPGRRRAGTAPVDRHGRPGRGGHAGDPRPRPAAARGDGAAGRLIAGGWSDAADARVERTDARRHHCASRRARAEPTRAVVGHWPGPARATPRMPPADPPIELPPDARAGGIFLAFLKLGLTSFGGPVAHLGYLRAEFVQRRGWLDEARLAQLLAICQFLPGPARRRLAFAVGLPRGGWRGARGAFLGFAWPSAVLLFGSAALAPMLGTGTGAAALHGLKLVAVVVVAHALMGMARQIAPDWPRLLIA